jgi:hypothetical protein
MEIAKDGRAAYESGMSIRYDEAAKQAVVTFRGQQITLSRRYFSAQEAREAGEHYCRQIGWSG